MHLQRGGVGEPDEIASRRFLEIDLAPAGERPLARGDQRQPVLAEGEAIDILGQRMLGGKTEIGGAGRNGGCDVRALALLDIDIDVGMLAQEHRKRARQMLGKARRIGQQMHAGAHPRGKAREVAAQIVDIVDHESCMVEQAFAGRGELDAATAALEQHDAQRILQALDAGAGGSERKMRTVGAARDAAAVRYRDEEVEIDQVEAHEFVRGFVPSPWTKAGSVTSTLCRLRGSVNVGAWYTSNPCSISSPAFSCSRASSRAWSGLACRRSPWACSR